MIEDKIKSREEIAQIAAELKSRSKRIVFIDDIEKEWLYSPDISR